MSTLKRIIVSAALGVAALALAAPSYATVLVAGSGWQHDSVTVANDATTDSPLTFTVAAGQTDLFSLTDGFIAGDTYKVIINGLVTATSTFTNTQDPSGASQQNGGTVQTQTPTASQSAAATDGAG